MEWISVKDRLPSGEKEEGKQLLTYNAIDDWMEIAVYRAKDECWLDDQDTLGLSYSDDITHWRELPEPPKDMNKQARLEPSRSDDG